MLPRAIVLPLAEIDEGDKQNALAAIGNVRAMEAALSLADRITEGTILVMHNALLQHQPGLEREAGRYRSEQVWIGPGRAGPRTADFVARSSSSAPARLEIVCGSTPGSLRCSMPTLRRCGGCR